jgi:hypothetical protein
LELGGAYLQLRDYCGRFEGMSRAEQWSGAEGLVLRLAAVRAQHPRSLLALKLLVDCQLWAARYTRDLGPLEEPCSSVCDSATFRYSQWSDPRSDLAVAVLEEPGGGGGRSARLVQLLLPLRKHAIAFFSTGEESEAQLLSTFPGLDAFMQVGWGWGWPGKPRLHPSQPTPASARIGSGV